MDDWMGAFGNLWDTATTMGSDGSFSVPKTDQTATSNAIQSLAPVTASDSTSGSSWSGFWQGVLGGAVKTGEQMLTAQAGAAPVNAPGSSPAAGAAAAASQAGKVPPMVLVGAAVLVVYLVARKG